jgi:hypothetical protein
MKEHHEKDHLMKLDVYLNYAGNCEQAFRFYEQHLGGKITMMMTHGQQPNQANVPANWTKATARAHRDRRHGAHGGRYPDSRTNAQRLSDS